MPLFPKGKCSACGATVQAGDQKAHHGTHFTAKIEANPEYETQVRADVKQGILQAVDERIELSPADHAERSLPVIEKPIDVTPDPVPVPVPVIDPAPVPAPAPDPTPAPQVDPGVDVQL